MFVFQNDAHNKVMKDREMVITLADPPYSVLRLTIPKINGLE